MKRKSFNTFLAVFVFGLSLLWANIAQAGATLYFSPSTGSKVLGSTFRVAVIVNAGGQAINAADGTIIYDTDKLSVVGISKSGTIFDLWTVSPQDKGGSITFSGGMFPPGFSGSAGRIITITFRAKKVGEAQVRFSAGSALANDGKGTNILTSMGSASFQIVPKSEAPKQTSAPSAKPKPSEPKVEERLKPQIISETHPDSEKWYNNPNPEFKWELPAGVTDVSFAFNDKQFADPGPVSDGLFSEKKFENIKSGVWYFHLKFKDKKGWGTPAHYRVRIDTSPPLPFEVQVKEEDKEDWPLLYFDARDEHSGVVKYEIKIGSLDEQGHEVPADKHAIKAEGLGVGKHTAMVKAVDAAGNAEFSTVEFYIEPIEAPVIEKYPEEIKPSDRFYASGRTVANGRITLFLESQDKKLAYETNTDSEGKWFILADEELPRGRYVAYAKAYNNKGRESELSNKVSFLVTPPIFTRFGDFVINYFTVFVSLIFMLVVIVAAIVYLMVFVRKKLKRETIEAEEVLKRRLEDLKRRVANEAVRKRIEEAEKKIMKEIKDVEKILK